MRDGFRIFDAHAHIGRARHSGRACSAREMLESMDRAGIDRALLLPFPVVEDYRAAHDEIAAVLRAHPDRFAGGASVPPFLPEAEFRAEVRRCAEGFGFRALKLQPQYQPLNPVSQRSDFFFEAALEARMAAVCHTGTGAPFALPSLFIVPARRYPELAIVLAHAGGSVYYLEALVAAAVCPNIRLEVSSLMPHHIVELLAQVPADRMMVGSDLPESAPAEFGKVLGLDLPRETRERILWGTAAELFGPGSAPGLPGS